MSDMQGNVALQFGENLALLVLAAFFYGLITSRMQRDRPTLAMITTGVLFGLIAVVSMLFPVSPADGVLFDGRGIIVALAGPFGGGYASLIAGVMAGGYRLWVGGGGAFAGSVGIAAAALFGYAYWRLRRVDPSNYKIVDFLAIGALLPMVSLPSLFLLPTEVAIAILDRILVPMVIYEILGVLILGSFLRNEITRSNAAADLHFSEQRFRDFTEIGSDYYWETDTNGRFTYFSEQFEQVTGMPREEAVGLSRNELWARMGSYLYQADDELDDVFQKVRERKEFRRIRFVVPRSSGSDRVIEISGRPHYSPSGRFLGYRGVGLDVTKEVQAQREKEIAREVAEEARQAAVLADRAKTDFLARMSHELRSPLNAIIGFADVLARTPEGPLGAPVYHEYVSNIRLAGDHLQELIGDILDLSKVESGRLEFEEIGFSPKKLATHVQSILSDSAGERNNRIRVDLDDSLPETVVGDPTRIRQVAVNFLSNAVKFTSGGDILLAVRLLNRDADMVSLEFSVTDTGIGMTREQQAIVFEPFTQADVSVTRNFGGTGLGLSVCKRLVEGMGGVIGMESEREKGSRFWFSLTLACRDEPDLETFLPHEVTRLEPLHLLVVDDIEVNRMLAQALIVTEGHKVDVANDGAEALAFMNSDEGHNIDAVLMDIHMPHMNGMDTARMIRDSFGDARATVPIIALTADVMQENIRQYYEAGMNDFVGKPLKMTELNAALLKTVGRPAKTQGPSPEITDKAPETKANNIDITRLSVAFELYPDQEKSDVLDSLKSQCHQFIDAAIDAREAKDKDGLRMQLHTLKGVASNIGFNGLADLCRSLENQLKQAEGGTDIDLQGLSPALDNAVQEAERQPV